MVRPLYPTSQGVRKISCQERLEGKKRESREMADAGIGPNGISETKLFTTKHTHLFRTKSSIKMTKDTHHTRSFNFHCRSVPYIQSITVRWCNIARTR